MRLRLVSNSSSFLNIFHALLPRLQICFINPSESEQQARVVAGNCNHTSYEAAFSNQHSAINIHPPTFSYNQHPFSTM